MWALLKPRLQLFAPLVQLPREDGTVTGAASSSLCQQGESGDPSTSSTPAITFLIQEVRQSLAGLPDSAGGWQGCHACGRLGGWRAKLSYKSERQVRASAEGSREKGGLQARDTVTDSAPWAVTPSSAAGSDLRGPCSPGP